MTPTRSKPPPVAVLDSSALAAWLLREPGWEVVEAAWPAAISAVNLTELVIAAVRRGLTAAEAHDALADLPLTVVTYEPTHAYPAADLHAKTRGLGLSLGDTVCLALGDTLKLPVLTTDRAWTRVVLSSGVRLIR